jgi:hypothetical protein
VIADLDELNQLLRQVFPNGGIPKPLHLLDALPLIHRGQLSDTDIAQQVGTSSGRIRALAQAGDPEEDILGTSLRQPDAALERRVRGTLGQLVIGHIAEVVFEERYREIVGTEELRLQDDRQTRGDTDYLVFNGRNRQVYRINIKFHGSPFRRAFELVGLAPENCFALATYKIYRALQRQDEERLPYIFVIVGVPGLTGEVVGASIPGQLVHLASLPTLAPKLDGKRLIEDKVVELLTKEPIPFGFGQAVEAHLARIRTADWYVLSARRANRLLQANLFERAFALRVPRFAQNYRSAELDMHYSLSDDLRPLYEFLTVLRDQGMTGLASRLERGDI